MVVAQTEINKTCDIITMQTIYFYYPILNISSEGKVSKKGYS